MKCIATCAVMLGVVSQASSHYIFNAITTGGVANPTFTYIRRVYNNSPVLKLDSTDLRCNVGNTVAGNTTTAAVKAGSSVTFGTDTPVYHDGPVSVYMAKAPTTAEAFDGSGDVWFKILDIGPKFPGGTWDLRAKYTFNLPTCIPNGEYLLRIQSLAIHNPGSTPQWYVSCAQLAVTGGGTKDLGPKVAIPGAFKATDPGYTVNIYNNFNSYTVPGPAVATC
ncbi:lytic polysaccharide monooxygenase [Stipitochalara longipes BDJ]|nr:lytic polysaccharide monooxygenase [Stipitochalara longipes BDJ]